MSFDNIKLDKSLYTTSVGFTAALEELDPSENYKGTSLEGLDAFQRQLKRFDIKVSGKDSDTVEKFFKTSDSAALFPEYISRAVAMGVDQEDVVSHIVATTTNIDSLDYRTIISTSKDEDLALYPVNEGTHIPETTISTQDSLVRLTKKGRMLTASYEAIKYQRLDLFTVMLKQIGAHIAQSQLSEAIHVLINGDGNDNNIDTIETGSSGSVKYSDLVSLWSKLSPFNLTTLIVSPSALSKLLNLSEFKAAYSGLDFHATGKLITPFGAEIIKCNTLEEDLVIGLDRNYALQRVVAGPVSTEFDKLIDRQLERACITETSGFAKIYKDAAKYLSINY